MYANAMKLVEKYHDHDYVTNHLVEVVRLVEYFYPNEDENALDLLRVVALCHDLLEDTDCSLEELQGVVGVPLAWVVGLLTKRNDLPNRKAKNLENYHRLRLSDDAVFVKLCDRLQNVERSLCDKNFLKMYSKEHREFKAALWVPGKFENLWNELEGYLGFKLGDA